MKEMIRRTLRTFVQALCASVSISLVSVVNSANGDYDLLLKGLESLAISAVAAAIAAVMNMPKEDGDIGGIQ